MAEIESLGTMHHDAFKKNADGDFSLQTQDVIASALRVTSLTDAASVAAPTANTVIATLNLTAGTYRAIARTFISGTTVASLEQTNMRLRLGGVAVSRILNPVSGTSGATALGKLEIRIVTATTQVLDIVAVSNATASSLYAASISVIREA